MNTPIHEQDPAQAAVSANRFMDNIVAQRTLAIASLAAVTLAAAAGASRAQAAPQPALVPTERIDGVGFEAYPGDTYGPMSERGVFQNCYDYDGHESYVVKAIRASQGDPARKGTTKVDRVDIGKCDNYVDREITKAVYMTKVAGQSKWKTSRVPLAAVKSDDGKRSYNLKPLDWGQTLPKGKSMKAQLKVTTTVTNMTAEVVGLPLGAKKVKTLKVGKPFTVKR